jgi:hypothetical protein
LRTKPLRDFTVEDLRIMIAQQVALARRACSACALVDGILTEGVVCA